MQSNAILQYLSKHGQQVDYEIAEAMKLPLSDVRASLTALSKLGEISRCNVTRFIGGKPVEGMLCRISGTIPPKAPGRKPGA
ncbi:MAG TPA: FaeA/PapI family transcriptional regulator [Methylophilaceae bacterium]|nr:FaeA/PapI family transcriptional regulator [Methylophilaceae bacterium]